VFALGQQFERGAGEAPAFLDRLVGIGVAADIDRRAAIRRLGQFAAQGFSEVGLGVDPGFEVEAGRQVQVRMRGAGEAVDAAAIYDALSSVHFPALLSPHWRQS
jgi:hypothetical protein